MLYCVVSVVADKIYLLTLLFLVGIQHHVGGLKRCLAEIIAHGNAGFILGAIVGN